MVIWFFEFSVYVRAFVIGLSQVSSFFSSDPFPFCLCFLSHYLENKRWFDVVLDLSFPSVIVAFELLPSRYIKYSDIADFFGIS